MVISSWLLYVRFMFKTSYVTQVGERIVMTLRSDLFEAMIRREIAYFDREENSAGNVTDPCRLHR
jgi:ABC-type multidrug transport system fused ATPase/permease subunit